jgi:di/tricarboxylate transporter
VIVALAKEADVDPIKLLPFGTLGSFAGGLSPITPSGILAINTATASGIEGLDMPLFWIMALTNVLYAAVLYFIFKWHTHKTPAPAANAQAEDIPPFSVKQIFTLAGIVVTALLTALLKINVGLAAFSVSVVLTVIGAANEGAAVKKVPWNTLVMITGVGILISLVTELGGIDLLSRVLSSLMGPVTATPIMTILAGVMSWFSSASGVVMPTLIPTVPSIAATIQGVNPLVMTIGLCVGAHLAALSPLSSCGGLMLAAYSSEHPDPKDRNRTFAQLFAMSACGVVFAALLAMVGLYG